MIGLELSIGQTRAVQDIAPQPLAAFFESGGGQHVALGARPDGGVSIWTEIAPQHAAQLILDNGDTDTRLSWRETLVMELRNIYPVGDLALTGSWSQLQSSGSGLSGSYTGNRAISTSSQTALATVTVDRAEPYDLWIHFTGRTSGAYCRVDIDGSQALVNEIDDPAGLGFKAFSTYTATDLQRRQSVKVASGLTGSHAISIQNGGVATPGGSTLMIEAVGITGSLADPSILPPVWQPGTTYAMGDEVQFGGVFYAARANGVSGTNGPTHTGGIASDGALDWRADDRPTYPKFVSIDYASEREYAARFEVGGATTELGGQTHGNEVLQSRTITLDGSTWTLPASGTGLAIGAEVNVVESTSWRTGAGAEIGTCALTRSVGPGSVSHDVQVTGTGASATFEWLYAGMVPMVHWDGESRTDVVDLIEVAGSTPVVLADYAGISPPNLDFEGAQRIGIEANVDGDRLVYGHEAGALPVVNNTVNQFDTFLRPNLDATTEGGGLDWKAKAYVTGGADGGLAFGAGDALGFFSRHVLRID